MKKPAYFLSFLVLFLFSACNPNPDSPFQVNLEQGSFTFKADSNSCGPYQVEINEGSALKDGHLFKGSDSLVIISSFGGLDLLSIFKASEERASMQIRVVNPTDSSLEIQQLLLKSTTGSGIKHNPVVAANNSVNFWFWLKSESSEFTEWSLDLSGTAILLLPEEGITLPPLYFFSHLCDE